MASCRRTGTNESVSTYDSAGGKDYSTLQGWEEATDIDCVTGTVSPVLACYKGAHDDNDILDGAVTSSSYFRIVRPASGEGHSGIPKTDGSCVYFYSTASITGLLSILENYSSVQDIVGKATNMQAGNAIFGTAHNGISFIGVLCIGTTVYNFGAYLASGETGYFINLLSIDGDYGFWQAGNGGSHYLYNCTVVGNTTYGFYGTGTSTKARKNCIACGNGTNSYGTFSDTTCLIGTTPDFVDSANDNYMLDSTDTVAIDQGTDLSGDGNFAFDDDILKQTRDTSWDIGFHEWVLGVIELTLGSLSHTHGLAGSNLVQANTLGMNGLLHGNTLGNIGLTQAHILNMESLLHAHGLEGTALTQACILAAQGLAHGHGLGGIDLTQAHILVALGLAHGHTLENIGLSGSGMLSVQGLLHGHTLGNIDLTQANILSAAGLIHGNALENISLSNASLLAVNGLAHGHSLQVPALTQAHILSAAGLSHAHGIGNVVLELISGIDLVVQSLLHSHTLGNIDLTQAHILSAAGLSHAHGLYSPGLTQASTLAIGSLTHTHALDGMSLIVSLIIDSLMHGHTLGNTDLTQAHILSLGELLHAHGLSEPYLVQGNILPITEFQSKSRQFAFTGGAVTFAFSGKPLVFVFTGK